MTKKSSWGGSSWGGSSWGSSRSYGSSWGSSWKSKYQGFDDEEEIETFIDLDEMYFKYYLKTAPRLAQEYKTKMDKDDKSWTVRLYTSLYRGNDDHETLNRIAHVAGMEQVRQLCKYDPFYSMIMADVLYKALRDAEKKFEQKKIQLKSNQENQQDSKQKQKKKDKNQEDSQDQSSEKKQGKRQSKEEAREKAEQRKKEKEQREKEKQNGQDSEGEDDQNGEEQDGEGQEGEGQDQDGEGQGDGENDGENGEKSPNDSNSDASGGGTPDGDDSEETDQSDSHLDPADLEQALQDAMQNADLADWDQIDGYQEALDELKKEIEEITASENWRDELERAKRMEQQLTSFSKGNEKTKNMLEADRIMEICNRMANNDQFEKMLRIMGGLMAAYGKALRRNYLAAQVAPVDVVQGNDLRKLLKSELQNLAHPKLKKLARARFINKQMLQFKMENDRDANRGPVAIFMDVSGSMDAGFKDASRAEYAWAMALAITKICEDEGREVRLFTFDTGVKEVKFANFRDLLVTGKYNTGGGTSISNTFEAFWQKCEGKFDLVMLSDLDDSLSEEMKRKIKRQREELDSKYHLFLINESMGNVPAWKECFDTVVPVSASPEAMEQFMVEATKSDSYL